MKHRSRRCWAGRAVMFILAQKASDQECAWPLQPHIRFPLLPAADFDRADIRTSRQSRLQIRLRRALIFGERLRESLRCSVPWRLSPPEHRLESNRGIAAPPRQSGIGPPVVRTCFNLLLSANEISPARWRAFGDACFFRSDAAESVRICRFCSASNTVHISLGHAAVQRSTARLQAAPRRSANPAVAESFRARRLTPISVID